MFPMYALASDQAKALMKEEFYFNPADENGPFGTDVGALAWEAFSIWRHHNPHAEPADYIDIAIDRLDYPAFDLEESDIGLLHPYLTRYTLGTRYIFDIDSAIISIAFGQLYLEGGISPLLHDRVDTALHRQLDDHMLHTVDSDFREERREKLRAMHKLIEHLGS